ncbi:MAG: peptidase family, partial [Myxococcaceae bacterium]|nr:peptidase family [Myxococcaceae bacterium]
MDHSPPRRWFHGRSLALLAVAVAGCPHGQPGDDGEDFAIVVQAVTCDPVIERYPIAAAHNGGYDRAWSNFTCAPHPGGSPDNSDYGGDHHGNDLFAPRGSPIVAVRAGRVTRTGVVSGTSGIRVTVEDACGWNYYFGHLDSIAPGIAPGVRVVAGQVIGTLGDTGTTGTAPHLHFNVHRDGNYSNDVDPYPLLRAADATACDPTASVPGTPPPQTCAPRCEGTRLISRDCGRGDCAAYGAGCVDDALGARCVFFACPAVGEQDTCWLGRHIGHCRNGQLVSQGDCGAYGAACVQEGTAARCASPSCSARGEYDACIAGRYITRCRNGVASAPGDCGAFGATCVDDDLGARCVFFACRAQGEHDTCWLGRHRGRCFNGHLTAQADCGAQDGACVSDDLGARCTSTICPGVRGDVRFCVAPGRIAHCTNGLFDGYETDCTATGATCSNESPTTARCVPAGGTPP